MNTLLTILNAKFIHSSLALRCLYTACRRQGVAVKTAEYTINQHAYDILRRISKFDADIIGFSCYIWNIEMTCHIISLIKQVNHLAELHKPEGHLHRARTIFFPFHPQTDPPHCYFTLGSAPFAGLSGTISMMSLIPQPSLRQIFSSTSTVVFSPFSSLLIVE